MAGRGPFVLVVLLLTVTAGPLLAEFLPPGPASILDPAGASVGAAAIAILWALFVWPVLCRERTRSTVLAEGVLLFLLCAPFVVGLAHSHGTRWPSILLALAVVAGAMAVTGLWLAGPGRDSGRDRWFVACWVLVVAAVPLANWVLMDFVGLRGTLGFRISPVLAVRRILLEAPRADPVPFLVTALAFAAASASTGLLRKGAAAAVLLVLTGSATAADLVPLLGDRYVPGRPVPMRLEGADGRVMVRLPGRWAVTAAPGEVVFVPGIEGLRSVEVDGEVVPVDLRAAPAGRWLVTVGPVPEELRAAADSAGFVISRALPPDSSRTWREYLPADGLIDVAGSIPGDLGAHLLAGMVRIVEGPGDLPDESPLRRPWEESGRILSADGLQGVFRPGKGPDPTRARDAFLVLAIFSACTLASLRYGRRNGRPGLTVAIVVPALAVVACLAVDAVLPERPEGEDSGVSATYGSRQVSVFRIHANRETVVYVVHSGLSVPLGRGREVSTGIGDHVPLGPGETRLLAQEGPGQVEPGPFDFFLTPDGLAKPGEPALPPAEFIRLHLPGPDGWLVRKLLRLDGSLEHRYGVRIPSPGHLEVLRTN